MSDQMITPAVPIEDWLELLALKGDPVWWVQACTAAIHRATARQDWPAVMAIANALRTDEDAEQLLAGDPAKLTWAMVDALREEVRVAEEHAGAIVGGFNVWPRIDTVRAAADAVATLLSPRGVA